MKVLSNLFGSMVEARSLALSAAFVAVVFLFAGTTQQSHAADQIRFKVLNDSGYIINKLEMMIYPGGELSNTKSNFSNGATRNVKYNIGDSQIDGSVSKISGEFFFNYHLDSSRSKGTCSKYVSLNAENQQFNKAVMPDGTDISDELNHNNQIILVRYKLTGTPKWKKCRYQGYKVYKR